MAIILSRTNDKDNHSKGWIVGYALLFWLSTKILAVLLVVGCTLLYKHLGYSKDLLPVFGGVPQGVNSHDKLLVSLLSVAVITPLLQEIVFRLGLSFKKWQVGLALASLPVFIAWSSREGMGPGAAAAYLAVALVINFVITMYTSQPFWDRLKARWFVVAMWVTSIAYGLVHLFDFSYFAWDMLPYMLCMISTPFFCGCACAYLRVNLGFWWGFGMHCLGNLPGIFAIILMSIH